MLNMYKNTTLILQATNMQEFFAKIKTRLLTCIEAIDNFEIFKEIVVPVVKFSLAFLIYRISKAWLMLGFLQQL